MKNFFTYSIITIQNFALFIFSILAIIFYTCFNLDFYKNFYEKENLAPSINTTNSELIDNTENLLAYLKGNAPFADKVGVLVHKGDDAVVMFGVLVA